MHIAFLTPEYPHKSIQHSAGLGTSIKNLAFELVKLKHSVTIFVYSQNRTEVIEENGIKIHKIAYKKHPFFSWYFYRKDIQKYINTIINKQNIDLLEAADWTGITAFMKINCPLFIRLHGSDAYFCNLENRKQKKKNFYVEKVALKSANHIISVSKFTAVKTKEIFNLTKEITVIHNGIDIEKFSTQNIAVQPNTILYFGSIIRKKGVLELASIFNAIVNKNSNATLTLLGKDVIDVFENKSTLSLFKEKLNPKALQNFKHVKQVPYNKVKAYIASAKAVVLPSFAEAFPMTWLEAMAMKKALVTSNIGWVKELMIHGETGYTVHPTNHVEFANKVINLLENDTLNLKMGNNAHAHITANFLQQHIAKKNIKFYKESIK